MASDLTAPTIREPKRIAFVVMLMGISTLSPFAMNIYLPSVDGMMSSFSATAAEIQLTLAFYFIAIAVAQIFLGPISDQFGRRPVVLVGMVVFVIGSVLCLWAPTVEALIAARVVQAVGGGAGLVLARAIVRDVYGRDKAASMIGYVAMGMAVAPTIGPAIGGFLDAYYGWRGGFVLMLLFGIGVTICSWLYLPETNQHKKAVSLKQIGRGYAELFREKMFWVYCGASTFMAWLYFAYLGGAPFVAAGVFNMTPAEIGVYLMVVSIGYIIGNYITGRVAARAGIARMIAAGIMTGVFGVSLLLVGTLTNSLTGALFFLPMFFIGLGNGLGIPSAISGAVSIRPDLAGTASGMLSFLQVGIGALVSSVVAYMFSAGIAGGGEMPMILVMVVGGICGLACVLAVFFGDGKDATFEDR